MNLSFDLLKLYSKRLPLKSTCFEHNSELQRLLRLLFDKNGEMTEQGLALGFVAKQSRTGGKKTESYLLTIVEMSALGKTLYMKLNQV